MNRTIKELAEICRKNPLGEKLLFVPSHSVGHQIGLWLVKSDIPWVNLRTTTVASFASEAAFLQLSKTGLRVIDSDERLAIVEEICRKDAFKTTGTGYFGKAAAVPGLVKALSNTIHELRMAELRPHMVSTDSFLVPAKGREIVALLANYESALTEKRLIDHAGLLSFALEITKERPGAIEIVMVLSDFPLTRLETELVRAAGGSSITVIGHDMPVRADQPRNFFQCDQHDDSTEIVRSDISLLKWILNPEVAPAPVDDGTVEFFHSLGESNEVREVFRRVLAAGIPLDEVEIVIPAPDPYGPLIRDVADSIDLPITLSQGVSIVSTRPGMALILYLTWLAEDFSDKYLRQLLGSGYIELRNPEGRAPLSARQAVSLLREAQIAWGRERYVTRLMSLKQSYVSSARQWLAEGDEEKAERAEEMAEKVAWLQGWVEGLLQSTPDVSGPNPVISRDALCTGCLSFIGYCRVAGEMDGTAKSALAEMLERMQTAPTLSDSLPVVARRFIKTIEGLSLGHSGPKSGCIHVADYRSAGWSNRSHTFIVGLDQARFPGAPIQDPIILDTERTRLSPAMALSNEYLRGNVYVMARLLASLHGKVTLSYPCRDLLDDRELLPSALILNAYRLISGKSSADYSDLTAFLGEGTGFMPSESTQPLSDTEWWFSQWKKRRYEEISVFDCYSNLKAGREAEVGRTSEVMSVFDGHVRSACSAFDPYSKNRAISASQLESLAKCPFRFYLTYLLHVEPLEEKEKDPNRWLDGAQRGGLLHDVFREFMETIVKKGELPNRKAHWNYLKSLALKEIEKWKDLVAPASTFAVTREITDILQSCETFLIDEEERCRTVQPVFFECAFGLTSDGLSPAYPAVEISVGNKGSFMLRGRIDRIDKSAEHSYEVWDYKTGSTYGFKESDYYRNGRQIQHVLYSMAAESFLRDQHDKSASVRCGGYYFPGPKGEGLRIERDQTRRDNAFAILDNLFGLLKTGTFPFAHDKGECSYCDYSSACGGGERSVARCRALLEGQDLQLDPLRRLLS